MKSEQKKVLSSLQFRKLKIIKASYPIHIHTFYIIRCSYTYTFSLSAQFAANVKSAVTVTL